VGQSIKVLLLEDVADDAELELYELHRAGIECSHVRVHTEESFRNELDQFNPDIVLSDFSLPGFGGMPALAITREKYPDIPFIFVSGTIGEERAIESFKRGATDYVLKTNLSRLGPVVKRALQERHERITRRNAEQALLKSEEKFRAIVETTQDWIWEIDRLGYCTFSSPFISEILGYSSEEVVGTERLSYVHREDRTRIIALLSTLKAEKRGWSGLISRWRHKDGTYRSLESNAIPLLDSSGEILGYRGTDRDVTERIRQQEKISRLSRINAISSSINATIVRVHDRKELFNAACRIAVEQGEFKVAWIGNVEFSADGALKIKPVTCVGLDKKCPDNVGSTLANVLDTGCTEGRVIKEKKVIVSKDIATDSHALFKNEALARGYRSLVGLPLQIDDEVVAIMVLYATQPNIFDDRELKLLNNLAADLSFALDHIEKEEKLNYLSYYDVLTGLPNRTLFCDRVNQLVNAAKLEETKVAVLAIDLERFRNVNETLGRHAGDELLKQIARRLGSVMPAGSDPARLSGDCFAIAIPFQQEEAEIAHMVEHDLGNAFLQPLTVAGVELRTPAKFGIALFPNDGSDGDGLIMNAEAALKKAKDLSDRYAFYTPQMHARIAERLMLENKLRQALEENQFVLHYQPKINIKTRCMSGLEALIRWQSPEHGLVAPGKFIYLLEETDLIKDVGRWVIEKASADYWDLVDKGLQPPRIAVNVSSKQLKQKEFIDDIARIFKKHNRGCDMDIEVTESLIMEDLEGSIDKLKKLRAMGVAIALDDFGTGFSSLSYLVKLPIDCLKIDRSFVVDMTDNADSREIVAAVVSLAHSLNLKVIAEGVETLQQTKLLEELNCDEIQGYYFSHPVPLQQIEAMLRNQSRW